MSGVRRLQIPLKVIGLAIYWRVTATDRPPTAVKATRIGAAALLALVPWL